MKRSIRFTLAFAAASLLSGCLADVESLVITTTTSNPACDGSGVASGSGALSVGGTGGCIATVSTELETQAGAIRNSSQYTFQTIRHSVDGSRIQSNSLIANRFEYAHALDLTGAEQIIAVYDAGFYPAHQEFLDKSVAFGFGTDITSVTVDSHGTAVAALAAGTAQWGATIGGAPNASLLLSSWNDGTDSAAVVEAESVGAIALNNSWGYVCTGDAFDECGINDYSIGLIGSAYRNALLDYAGDEGIVVFSASNEEAQTQATYMAALPALVPALEEGWLAVINLARDYDPSSPTLFDDTNVGLLSSGCFEAARWCVAADGTSNVATTVWDQYEPGTGTSYAAPRVSAAIAILAEAFPNLSTKEIRNRLLMTADNAFFAADTAQIQTLTFQNGLSHEYHWVYGHGFIDLRAALLPIGGATTTTSKGTVLTLGTPVIRSNGASGDAVQTALAKVSLYATDAMGGEFIQAGDSLVSTYSTASQSNAKLATIAGSDVSHVSIGASPFDTLSGVLVPFSLDQQSELSLKLPQTENGAVGIKLNTSVPSEIGLLSFGLSAQGDGNSLLGLSLGDSGTLKSAQFGVSAAYSIDFGDASTFELAGHTGKARSTATGFFDGIDDVSFGSLGVKFSQSNMLAKGDKLSLYANRPTAIRSGSAQTTLNLTNGGATPRFTQVDIPLAPTARETEFGFEYATQGLLGESWILQGSTRLNATNIADNDVSNLLLGVKMQF